MSSSFLITLIRLLAGTDKVLRLQIATLSSVVSDSLITVIIIQGDLSC